MNCPQYNCPKPKEPNELEQEIQRLEAMMDLLLDTLGLTENRRVGFWARIWRAWR